MRNYISKTIKTVEESGDSIENIIHKFAQDLLSLNAEQRMLLQKYDMQVETLVLLEDAVKMHLKIVDGKLFYYDASGKIQSEDSDQSQRLFTSCEAYNTVIFPLLDEFEKKEHAKAGGKRQELESLYEIGEKKLLDDFNIVDELKATVVHKYEGLKEKLFDISEDMLETDWLVNQRVDEILKALDDLKLPKFD